LNIVKFDVKNSNLSLYLSEGKDLNLGESADIISSLLIGGFFGFFISK
jgi:hypothetical protein